MTTGLRTDWTEFVPRLSAEWQASEPDRLHRPLTGTLVSADLSGFTAMSERLAAAGKEGSERLTAIVNSCFEALISVAHRGGGDVLKFGGDALLLVFDGEEGAVRAARAAAHMQRVIGGSRFAKLGLKMSVGAHHGEFDLFLVGEPDWRELVLAGRSVTRTVELESAAAAGQVLVSRELAAQLPARWIGRRSAGGRLLDIDAVPRARSAVPNHAPPASAVLVAPSLREEVRALAALGGEHRIATVIFLEVEGTDHTLEEVGPASFARGLDALVRAAQSLHASYGVQFLYTDVIADGIKLIATAGAPTSTVNDDEAALRAAVGLVHGDPMTRLKGGVNRGRVFAGFLGASDRHTYTVMGDPVNLAARLMAHAEPGQVVVSTEVVEGSRAEIRSTPLPPFLVKGKEQPVTAVVVEEVTAGRRSAPALTELQLVGRESEVARLGVVLGDVAEGRGRAIEIIGDAGIGKSRLVAEVASDERIFLRVVVECQPYNINTAYAAAKVILRRVLGIRYSATPEEAGAALRRIVARARRDLLPMLPLIAVAVDARVPPTPEVDAIASEFVLARTHDAIIDLLTAVVVTPTLLLVEDAYYADAASAALFSAVAQRISDRPWMLVATSRPETSYLLTGSDDVERMELEPLSAQAATELAEAALEGAPDILTNVRVATQRAGGNPLFVLRLMEAVRAGVAAEDLPESVERIVAERLDRLTPADRTLLRYAAVLGSRFDANLLSLVLTNTGQPQPDSQAWQRLDDLVEVEDARIRRFRHVLYRDVAYEGLPFVRRGRLHQKVGELLEASRHADDVALLAEHFFRAGDHERTWRYSVAAGDRAWQQLAVAEASVAYERALLVRPRVRGLTPGVVARVAEALGDVKERTADYDDADRRYRVAFKIRDGEPAGSARLLRKRGVLREKTGRYRHALRWYDRGLAAYEATKDKWGDAPLMVAAAGVLFRMGRKEDALEMATRAAEHAVLGKDVESEAHACLVAQACSDELGRNDSSYGRRSLALFTELGNVLYQGKALNNVGVSLYYSGDWSGSAEHYRLAAERFDAAGDVMEAATARSNLAEILSDQGHTAEAVAGFQASYQAFHRAGYVWGEAVVLGNLGRAQARDGDGAGALKSLVAGLELLNSIGAESFAVETQLRIVEARLLAGSGRQAKRALEEVAARVGAGAGFPGSDAFIARLRCWYLRQLGRPEDALVQAGSAVELAAQGGARFERAVALNDVAALTGDRAIADEVAAELAALGVVRLPAPPVPL